MPTGKKINWWTTPEDGHHHEISFHVEWGCCCDMNVGYPRDKLAQYADVIPEQKWNEVMCGINCCSIITCPINTFVPIYGCCLSYQLLYPICSYCINWYHFDGASVVSAPVWINPDAWKFDLEAAAGKQIYDQHGNRDPDGKVGSGDLYIHEARYGWANNIWEPEICSHGAGCKDVTAIVRNDVHDNELNLNLDRRGQFFNQHFWPETASGPAIPRKVAIRSSFGRFDGDIFESTTRAIPHETVSVHISRMSSVPRSKVVRDSRLLSKYRGNLNPEPMIPPNTNMIASAPTNSISSSSVAYQIRELVQMKKDGLLSEEEFTAAKANVLGLNYPATSAPPPYATGTFEGET